LNIRFQKAFFHARTGLIALGLSGLAASCGGSATTSSIRPASAWTAVTFTFKVAGHINTTAPFYYDVALTASPDPNPLPQFAPLPVITDKNPNGRVAGCPTSFVEFNASDPYSALPFILYRFAPNPGNASNPVNLAVFAPSTRGQIDKFTTPQTGGSPDTLSFTLYTNMLADTDQAARKLKSLQVNILTMTRLANHGASPRIIDALGDTRKVSGMNQFLTIDLRRDGIYTNDASLEPAGDTFGGTEPDVDLIDYKITVTLP
jgi:hypothetical protein